MHRKSSSESGTFSSRVFLAFLFCSTGILLAISSFTGPSWKPVDREEVREKGKPERYMPVPGGEADDLNRLEAEWNNRLTYPTGLFDPTWVRIAAVQDALVQRSIPAGTQVNLSASLSPLALNPTGFTSLGPKPLRMTGCSGCFNYNFAEGRINNIAIDPTTTTNGTIVAYAASVGGGEATGIPPSHDLESAILRATAPAAYTAILRGKTGSGIAVVEIYNIR